MSDTLVAYFSASGVTKRVAQDLAEAVDGDLFEIVPETPYTTADLNWQDARSRTTLEKEDDASRPAIASSLDSIAQYSTVFVGFPIWWYVEPRIIDTFLESYDFAGKTIVPFATSGGSGLGRAPERMQGIVPAATVRAGGLLNGRLSQEQLASWAESVV